MKSGFTLLELLLSSTLFVALLGSVWGITSLYLRTENYTTYTSERSRVNRLVVRMFNDDLTSAAERLTGTQQQLQFAAGTPAAEDIVTITYQQRQGIGLYHSALVRQKQPAGNAPALTDILPNVVECRFRYYDGTKWHDVWDNQKQTGLPKAVELAYRILPAAGAAALWESVIIALP
ncbi:MAG: type II secretion system protein GspJ [Planctomycetaceae bacterium]|jgi:Tfp pilus assembly protein PilV|nr:type II secretion system protein GspJ [Planctomycetaceae bacterium]